MIYLFVLKFALKFTKKRVSQFHTINISKFSYLCGGKRISRRIDGDWV